MNYDRYKRYTEKKYNTRGISSFFMKNPCDRVLLPYIEKLAGKEILEVGLGYGGYTRRYMDRNHVTGLDVNPDMGKGLGIHIIRGKADQISEKVTDKYDYVLSFFMTEYLAPDELGQFIGQAVGALRPGGTFATTVILHRGIGWLYVTLARIKGIRKYGYGLDEIEGMTSGFRTRITRMDSVMQIPFALFLEVSR